MIIYPQFADDPKDHRVVIEADQPTRDALRELVSSYEQFLDPTIPEARRLFPTAYPEDPELEAGFQVLAGDQLIESKKENLSVFLKSLDEEELTISEAQAWMVAINDLRLVLGTRLDVCEDDSVEELYATPEGELYQSLSTLVGMILLAIDPNP